MHEIYCVKDGKQYNITPLIGEISWESHKIALGEQINFSMAFNDDRYFPVNPIDLGSLIIIQTEDYEVVRGIVISEEKKGREAIQYVAMGLGFWLNKSKESIQFNKVNGKTAIETLLKKFNIPIGNITSINTVIDEIYNEKNVSDIITEILDKSTKETGIKYLLEFREGKLYIEKESDLEANIIFSIAENLEANVLDYIMNPTRKRSIEELRNKIKIVYTDDKNEKVAAEVQDKTNIGKYGILQEVQSIDKKDIAKAKNIANNLLKEMNKIFEENSIEVPGSDDLIAGRIINLNEKVTGMVGKYRIKQARHSVRSGIHMCNLDLEVI